MYALDFPNIFGEIIVLSSGFFSTVWKSVETAAFDYSQLIRLIVYIYYLLMCFFNL